MSTLQCPAVMVGNKNQSLALPVHMELQDGLNSTADWDFTNEFRATSHVPRMIELAYNTEKILRIFLYCVRALLSYRFRHLSKLQEHRCNFSSSGHYHQGKVELLLHIQILPNEKHISGEKLKVRGAAIHLKDLFTEQANEFKTVTVTIYGKLETVSYLKKDLLWGKKLYQKLLLCSCQISL